MNTLFESLEAINGRPAPFEFYTALELWNDPYISGKMLEAHLDPSNDVASRKKEVFEEAIDFMVKRFNIGKDTTILDLGCGPGLYATRFAELGASVIGVDFAERSIEYAKLHAEENSLAIDYHCQNYLDFSADQQFDLVILIQRDFTVLSPDQRSQLLAMIHTALKPNGLLFFDVFSVETLKPIAESASFSVSSDADYWSNFWSEEPYYVFTNVFKYDDSSLLLTKYTVIKEHEVLSIYNWMQHYTKESLVAELAANQFKTIECYADITGKPYSAEAPDIAVVAQKTN